MGLVQLLPQVLSCPPLESISLLSPLPHVLYTVSETSFLKKVKNKILKSQYRKYASKEMFLFSTSRTRTVWSSKVERRESGRGRRCEASAPSAGACPSPVSLDSCFPSLKTCFRLRWWLSHAWCVLSGSVACV